MPQDQTRLERWQNSTETPLLVLAVGTLPLLILELASNDLPSGDKLFLYMVNLLVFVAFGADYVVKLALTEKKSLFFKNNLGNFLIVISQFLALTPALGVLGFLRGARAIRVVVLFARFLGLGLAAKERGRAFFKRRAASFAFYLAGLTIITSAVAFTIVEDVGQGQRINSFFDALWWSISTITTVGYGDIYPITGIGRAIAAFTMVVGITTLAIVTARLAQFLVSDDVNSSL
jgi:voltage-gated potassium channel